MIRPLLESAHKTEDGYMTCAVLYLLKSGCQWRMLPSDFPKWRTVHHYFSIWSHKPEDEDSLKALTGAWVQVAKRSQLYTFAVTPQRWVAERSFAWLEKCRRLWKNTERLLNTSLQYEPRFFGSVAQKMLNRLLDQLESVRTRDELPDFILALIQDFMDNRDDWEKPGFAHFLRSCFCMDKRYGWLLSSAP